MHGHDNYLIWIILFALGAAIGGPRVIQGEWHWLLGWVVLPVGVVLLGMAVERLWRVLLVLWRRR